MVTGSGHAVTADVGAGVDPSGVTSSSLEPQAGNLNDACEPCTIVSTSVLGTCPALLQHRRIEKSVDRPPEIRSCYVCVNLSCAEGGSEAVLKALAEKLEGTDIEVKTQVCFGACWT